MTLCIAIKREHGVDVWADTRATGGSHGIQVVDKIFVAHKSVYTFSGTSDIDALFVALSTPRRKRGEPFPLWYNRTFASHLEDIRRNLGEQYSFDLIAVDKGQIWVSQGVTMLQNPVNLACIGAGAGAAYGVLHYLEHVSPKAQITDNMVLNIFRSVALHDETVGFPIDRWRITNDTVEKERYLK